MFKGCLNGMQHESNTSNAPKYVAVYNGIKTEILSGKYASGDFLPPESNLMEQFDASRTTIRRAIAMLRSELLVNVQQGRGTEVLSSGSSPTPFDLQKSLNFGNIKIARRYKVEGEHHTTTQYAMIDIVPAEIKFAKILGVELGASVFRLQRVKLVNELIFAFSTSYVSCTLTPGLDQYNGKIANLYSFLHDTYGINVYTVEDAVTTVQSGFLESKLLNVSIGSPLLLFRRTAFSDSQTVEYAETLLSPVYFELVITMERAEHSQHLLNTDDNPADL